MQVASHLGEILLQTPILPLKNINTQQQKRSREKKMNVLLVCYLEVILLFTTVQSQSNCSSFLYIPLLDSSHRETGNDRTCENCTAESTVCPPWYILTTGGSCKFGKTVHAAVQNIPSTMQTKLQYLFCMTSKTDGSQVLSSCLLSLPHLLGANYFLLPCNTSELNKFMCSKSNRDGQLCGKCREGFAPPVYSYSLTCVILKRSE